MIRSAVNRGMTTTQVEVEIRATFGKPGLIIIGLPSRVLDEARERISAALVQAGVRLRPQKTVVNLAPADIDKKSSSIELAIAVAILSLYGVIKLDSSEAWFLGELSLDGRLRRVTGFVSLILAAVKQGIKRVYFPAANLSELPQLPQLECYPLHSLAEFLAMAGGRQQWRRVSWQVQAIPHRPSTPGLEQVAGQALAKQALELVAAGQHHLLLFGEPGVGKSLLVRSIAGLLAPLGEQDFLAVNRIYSLAGLLKQGLLYYPPLRMPHQSITQLSLLGGGAQQRLGEISLAHAGVLFLDEFAEFVPRLLEMLRQPMESGWIELGRGATYCRYPARFTLVAASNPCPCGYLGSHKPCRCSAGERRRYQSRFSGPMLDRFDLMLRLEAVQVEQLSQASVIASQAETLAAGQRVQRAVARQRQRYLGSPFSANAHLQGQAVMEFCQFSSVAKQRLDLFATHQQLSNRQYHKLVKVARTLADLADREVIQAEQVMAACNFRDFF